MLASNFFNCGRTIHAQCGRFGSWEYLRLAHLRQRVCSGKHHGREQRRAELHYGVGVVDDSLLQGCCGASARLQPLKQRRHHRLRRAPHLTGASRPVVCTRRVSATEKARATEGRPSPHLNPWRRSEAASKAAVGATRPPLRRLAQQRALARLAPPCSRAGRLARLRSRSRSPRSAAAALFARLDGRRVAARRKLALGHGAPAWSWESVWFVRKLAIARVTARAQGAARQFLAAAAAELMSTGRS